MVHQHQRALGRFAFDDPMLENAIAHVCLAHGLRQHELEDLDRFPERRDIRDEPTNVKLLAILLRIGDLLDLSTDRACPLLLNAASPLPSDSFAHWTQYQRLTHRLTAPDQIAIRAECHTQQEHRLLQDWCQWIVDEVRNARLVMPRSSRHSNWVPPRATIDGPDPTVSIRPSARATYLPSKWVFELDRDAVFERLIRDVYTDSLSFVRELIQNALDAMRCQLYLDRCASGCPSVSSPTMINQEWRDRYQLDIALEDRSFYNDLLGKSEQRQVLVLDDCGIGMDRAVIEQYFLQVGRSYYTTDSFRRKYSFTPTSRFGVGFLSVFAASEHVSVDTLSSQPGSEAILMILTGPRNYLLTERGTRRRHGTRIEVELKSRIPWGELTRVLRGLCLRVEFPISITENGSTTRLVAEGASQFTYDTPDVTEQGARLFVRAFPVMCTGIEGELYVFGRVDARGESWAAWDWARDRYSREHPEAAPPPFAPSATCLNGLLVNSWGDRGGAMRARLDYRGPQFHPLLSREGARGNRAYRLDPPVVARWEQLLREHLHSTACAQGPQGWRYKQRLVRAFPLPGFWRVVPECLRILEKSGERCVSLQEVTSAACISTFVHRSELMSAPWHALFGQPRTVPEPHVPGDAIGLVVPDLLACAREHRQELFASRSPRAIRWCPDAFLEIEWGRDGGPQFGTDESKPVFLVSWPESTVIGFHLHPTTDATYGCVLLNSTCLLIQWLVRVKTACVARSHDLAPWQFDTLMSLLDPVVRYHGHAAQKLVRYLDQWARMKSLPEELVPPSIDVSANSIFPEGSRIAKSV